MTILDWGLLILWLGITLSGFWKGAVRIVFGIGGILLGLWLALVTGADLALYLNELLTISWLAEVLARLLPIVGCLLIFGLAGWGIDHTLKAMHLGWLNRLGGAFIAALVAALLLGALLVTAVQVSPSWARLCADSVIAPHLLAWTQALVGGA